MDDAFRAELQARLADFQTWSRGRAFVGCRLVMYCGVELAGAQSLSPAEVEPTIEALVCEGFYVDWAEHETQLYLRVWEYGGPDPEWPKVFAEMPLADVTELLRNIGENANQ